MGVVIPLKKRVDYTEVSKVPETAPERTEVPQQEKPRTRSWLGRFVALVMVGGSGGILLAVYYGSRIYSHAVADGVHPSTARVISVIPAASLCTLLLGAILCLIFWAWASPGTGARWIRGE